MIIFSALKIIYYRIYEQFIHYMNSIRNLHTIYKRIHKTIYGFFVDVDYFN